MSKKEFEIIEHSKLEHLKIFVVNLFYRNIHIHNDVEICLVLNGSVAVTTNKTTTCLAENDLIVFNPMQPHELKAAPEPSTILSLQISSKFCLSYFPSIRNLEIDTLGINRYLSPEEHRIFRALLLALSHSYYREEFAYEFYCFSLLNMIFHHILRQFPYRIIPDDEMRLKLKNTNRINRIMNYIDDHYMEKLLLADIARKEQLSVPYLSHFFKDNFNMSFQEYLSSIRFSRAKELIETTDQKLVDICMESGFSSGRYLNREFTKRLGCAPNEYKKQAHKETGANSTPSCIQTFYDKEKCAAILKTYFERSASSLIDCFIDDLIRTKK